MPMGLDSGNIKTITGEQIVLQTILFLSRFRKIQNTAPFLYGFLLGAQKGQRTLRLNKYFASHIVCLLAINTH